MVPYALDEFLRTVTGQESPPPAWGDLKFNPMGLYNLHRCMGILTKESGIVNQYSESFLATEIAWFVAGASDDRIHHLLPNYFHPWFHTSQENLPLGRIGNKI
jgi:hypothetical protein